MKEDHMPSVMTIRKAVTCVIGIVFLTIMILAIIGASQDSQDVLKKIRVHGTDYTFRARILEKIPAENMLVVQKTNAANEMEKRIYVLVTSETRIGYWVYGAQRAWQPLAFKNLKRKEHIVINGRKMTEREDGLELIYVEAKRIEPSE
jgi:hypothetical protein